MDKKEDDWHSKAEKFKKEVKFEGKDQKTEKKIGKSNFTDDAGHIRKGKNDAKKEGKKE